MQHVVTPLILSRLLTLFCLVFIWAPDSLKAQTNETLAPGAYIINMGVMPQTIDNALKPYGLLFELLSENYVPVKWVIRPNKNKDEYDFIYKGTQYKGGPFIVLAAHRTPAINAIITSWEGLGVVGTTTTDSITVPVYQTIDYFMNWTLDQANGSKVVPYFANAGIDASSYNWVLPSELTCCNDIFVMPHADPVWETHSRLFSWVNDIATDPDGCDGSIWAACHAVSALENAFNPANPSQQMNFLSEKIATATGTDDWADNSLQLWGDHGSGTLPPAYMYSEHGHPVMQFLGNLDAATENGSEQIYIPKSFGWRIQSQVGVYDHDHPDLVSAAAKHRAAKVVYGDAFGDPTKGKVMYEGGHSHAGTGTANIAAQRAFFNFSFWSVQGKAIRVAMGGVPNPAILDERNTVTLTANANGGTEVFNYQWVSSCGGSFSNANAATTIFTPPDVNDPTSCAVTCIVTDDCGTRTGFASEGITIIPAPQPPVAMDDNDLTNPGVAVTVDALANDTDPNLDLNESNFTFLTPTTTSSGGVFVYNGDGTVTYTPDINFIGTDTIIYVICDETAVGETPPGPYCDTAKISILVDLQDQYGCFPGETYQTLYSGYVQGIDSEDGMSTTFPAVGKQNNVGAKFDTPGTDWIVLDLGEIIAQDDTIFVYLSKEDAADDGVAEISGSATNSGFSGIDSVAITAINTVFEAYPYIVSQAAGVRYLRIAQKSSSENDIFTDGVSFNVKECVSDCVLPEIPISYSGTADDYDAINGIDGSDALGVLDLTGTQVKSGDTLILDLTDNIPNGGRVMLYMAHNGTASNITVSGSDDNSSYSGSVVYTPTSKQPDFAQFIYDVSQTNGVRYLKFAGTTERIDVDGIAYDIDVCEDGTPVISADVYTICEDNEATFNVVANDTDPHDLALTPTIVTGPTNGTAITNTNGTITYLPNTDYDGADAITYKVCNSEGACSGNATITITITDDACPAGQSKDVVGAVIDSLYATHDAYLFQNTNDENHGTCTELLIKAKSGQSARGILKFDLSSIPNTAVITSASLKLYETGGAEGGYIVEVHNMLTDWVEGTFCEATGDPSWDNSASGSAWSTSGGDYAATIIDSKAITTKQVFYEWNVKSLVETWVAGGNNYGLMLKYEAAFEGTSDKTNKFASSEHGTPANRPQLIINYIDYSCTGGCITMPNQAPLAVNDTATTPSNTPVNIDVQANDTDPETGTLTTTIDSAPASGTATVQPNGTITYDPQGFLGTMTFTYSVCDNGSPSACDTATVVITTTDAPPTAEDDVVTATFETTESIDVLADNGNGADSDPESQDLTISAITVDPVNGTATINDNGTPADPTDDFIDYTPYDNFTGYDTLYYAICDPASLCDTAMVAITVVNQAPVTDNETATTDECQPVTVDVLTGDTDPEGGVMTVTLANVTAGSGTATINYGQTVTFTPDPGFTGAATIQYTVCDDGTPEECSTGTINITVNVGISGGNAAPIALDDTDDANIGQVIYLPVKDNDSDPEGTSFSVTLTKPGLTTPSLGTISLLNNQMIKYTPTGGTGTDFFQYWICESHPASPPGCPTPPSLCDSATVTVDIANQDPIAITDASSTGMDQATTIDVLVNDIEPDNQGLTITGAGTDATPSNGATVGGGTVTINDNGTSGDPSDDFIDYTPNTGFTGVDTFSYQICDLNVPPACDETIVTVEVTPPMDLQVSLSASQPTAPLGTSIVFTLTVQNVGGNTATGVLVKDQLPNGYTYVGDDSGGAYDPISGIWNVGTLLSSGGSSTVLITATLDYPTNTYNTAQVYNANEFDIDSTPNNDDGDQSEDDEAFVVVIPDSDGDGIADDTDVDDDNDGILDIDENNGTGFDPSGDADADGIPNYLDQNDVTASFPSFVDLDHNGVNDNFDHDRDGIPDHLDLDTDNDGIPDFVEAGGTDTNNDGMADYPTPGDPSTMTDLDNDGLADAYDPDYATAIANPDADGDGTVDAYDLDSDNDGIADLVEVGGIDTDGNGKVDEMATPSTGDTDNNGWADVVETTVLVNQSLADSGIDFDGDNIPNHLDLDADNDGILDVVESGGLDGNNDGIADDGTPAGTINDANGNGWDDNYDDAVLATVADGADGNSLPDFTTGNGSPDFDADGQPNWLDIDADNDGIVDNTEGQSTGGYIAPDGAGDTDGDGINDAYDNIVGFGGQGISPENTDQSDNPDYLDLDTDNDGETDLVEGHDSDGNGIADGGGPANTGLATGIDSDFDGLDDGFDNNIGSVDPTDGGLSGTSFVNSDGGTIERDWREVIDLDIDDDGITNAEEDGGTGFDPIADSDNDGILNYLDAADITIGFPSFVDTNGDGVNDVYDTDGDGIPDYKDLDADNDGIPDIIEAGGTDTDNNGIADDLTDTDLDGLVDTYDAGTTSNIPNPDTDGDGIKDAYDLDSDNDGIADLVEVGGLDTDGNGKVDTMTDPSTGDTDDNGWADIIETTVLVSQSLATDGNVDFDGDSYPNHLDIDADNDGIVDVREAGGVDANGDGQADNGSGTIVDANGDGWDDNHDGGYLTTTEDGADVNASPDFVTGTNNPDFDADGQPNWLDIDADNDGIVDNTEGQSTAGYIAPTSDSDADGLNDAYEVGGTIGSFGGVGITPVNTELVDNPDYLDLDTDNDGESDSIEGHDSDGDGIADGGSPSNTGLPGGYADTDGDGLLDGYDNNTGSTDPTNTGLNPNSHPDFDGNSSERDWRENATPDIDKDNDGIVDTDEDGGTGFDPSGDQDNDGTPNYLDTDDPAFTNTDDNGDGVVDAFDSDGDGIADFLDLDSDNDGITDLVEARGTDANNDGIADSLADSDGDGIPDSVDSGDAGCSAGDTNSDGICDDAQGGTDTDGDGIQDADDPDVDGDGLADTYDPDYNTAIANPDTDGDGLADAIDLDADNDGIPDLVEVGGIDTNGDGVVDPMTNPVSGDTDNNGWADIYGTNVLINTDVTDSAIDFDGDGIANHLDLDADNDGVPDVVEAGGIDTDGDGVADNYLDTDGDGFNDAYDPTDSDPSALNNAAFAASNNIALVTTNADANSDGLISTTEGYNKGDLEADGFLNFLDLDADNDGILDIVETAGLSADTNNDGMVDNYNPGTGNYDAGGDVEGDGYSSLYDTDDDNDGTLSGSGTAIILTGVDGDSDGLIDNYPNGDNDGDIRLDFLDVDADNDGILDNIEAQATGNGTNVCFIEPAGTYDAYGVDTNYGTYQNCNTSNVPTGAAVYGITPYNHDGDSHPDHLDLDADGDGMPDRHEAWDDVSDGDAVNDYDYDANCTSDLDGDGLLNCFDSDDNDPTVTVANTPSNDNGNGGSTTSTGFGGGNSAEEIFPNNGGDSGEIQPDWRDSQCIPASDIYYTFDDTQIIFDTTSKVHLVNAVQSFGQNRATQFCENGPWTDYYNPMESDKYMFSIEHGSNTTLINYITIRKDEFPTDRYVTNATNGYFVMARDWNVETIANDPLTGNVNVRFYFPQSDSTTLHTAAQNFATANGLIVQAPVWFKADNGGANGNFDNSDITPTGVAGATIIPAASYGTANGKHYVQFDGITGFSGGTLAIPVNASPFGVELLDFQAERAGNDAKLYWSTAQEVNSDYFRIERMAGNSGLFEQVDEVQAAGTTSEPKSYSYRDLRITQFGEKTLYYRLKAVDSDGSFKYSNVVELNLDGEQKVTLDVFPNPVTKSQVLNIQFSYEQNKQAQIRILNGVGQIIFTRELENVPSGKIQVSLENWSSGIYYVHLAGEGFSAAYKIEVR